MKFKKRIKRLENMLWDLRDQLSSAQAKLGRAYSKAEKAEMEEGRLRGQCREVEMLLKMARAKEAARKKFAKKSAKKRVRKAKLKGDPPIAARFSKPPVLVSPAPEGSVAEVATTEATVIPPVISRRGLRPVNASDAVVAIYDTQGAGAARD